MITDTTQAARLTLLEMLTQGQEDEVDEARRDREREQKRGEALGC